MSFLGAPCLSCSTRSNRLTQMNDRSEARMIADLPRLFVFAEVARRESFAAAADALGLSRSTVSHHVGALEEALSARLLERTTRSVSLTAAGQRLLASAEAILSEWNSATNAVAEGQREPRGTIVVTTPNIVAERIVVPTVIDFMRKYPACEVDLRITAKTLNLVREKVDVAVRAGPLPDSTQGARLLAETEHVIVGAPRLLERWPVESPRDLADAPWVDHRLRRRYASVSREGTTFALPQGHRVMVDSAGGLIALAVGGAGFALLPELIVQEELERGELVIVCAGWRATPSLSFHAVMPSPKNQSARVRRFVELLLARFAS